MTNKKNKLIPKLRFKECSQAWRENILGEVSKVVVGGTPSTDVEEYWGGDIGWIGSGELKNNIIRYPTKYITTEGLQQSSTKLLPQNTTVLAMTGATLGKIGFLNFECCGNQSVAGFVNLVNLDSKFLYYYLQRITKQIESLAGGGAQAGINKSNIENINIKIPSLKEQQKIANCLSSLDELIEAQEEKLKLLKEHKKGLMQQLFPQVNDNHDVIGGGNLPKLRFPEFINDGAWEEKTLGEISFSIFDGTHQTPKYTEEGIPFFSVENLISKNKNKFISKEDYLILTAKNKPEKDDILITRIGNIGFSTVVSWDYEFSIYVTLATVKKSDKFIPHYLNGYFQSEVYQKEIRSKSLLNAVPMKINMNDLRNTKVLLPTIKEQQKIADCLSSLDETIEAQDQKIELLKQHKKGLMQGLFPVMN